MDYDPNLNRIANQLSPENQKKLIAFALLLKRGQDENVNIKIKKSRPPKVATF